MTRAIARLPAFLSIWKESSWNRSVACAGTGSGSGSGASATGDVGSRDPRDGDFPVVDLEAELGQQGRFDVSDDLLRTQVGPSQDVDLINPASTVGERF